MNEFNYTITSSNHHDYATIHQNLISPRTELTEFMVTKLTTTCSFVILDNDDYIDIIIYYNEKTNRIYESFRLHFPRTFVELSQSEFIRLLNQVIGTNIKLYTDNLVFPYFRSLYRFTFTDMSYRMKLVLGMYDQKFINYRYHFVQNETFRIGGTVTPDDYIEFMFIDEKVQHNCTPSKEHIIADRDDHKAYHKLFEDMFGDKFKVEFKKMENNYKLYVISNRAFKFIRGSENLSNITGLSFDGAPMNSKSVEGIDCSVTSYITHYIIGDAIRLQDIIILTPEDFIEIKTPVGLIYQTDRYQPKREYALNFGDELGMLQLLRDMMPEYSFGLNCDNEVQMRHRNHSFEIIAISERLSKVTGFNKKSLPISSEIVYIYGPPSTPYYQLTPILYLTSNLGTTHYSYCENEYSNQKILMEINNYFINGFPIVCHNFEFSSIISSSALSNAWFQLVDANFHPVKLLSPMYISAIAKGIESKKEEPLV